MYGREQAQILLDAFDKMWDNHILSADFTIDVWQQSLAGQKGNLKICQRAKDKDGIQHVETYMKEIKETLKWLAGVHDERVTKYY